MSGNTEITKYEFSDSRWAINSSNENEVKLYKMTGCADMITLNEADIIALSSHFNLQSREKLLIETLEMLLTDCKTFDGSNLSKDVLLLAEETLSRFKQNKITAFCPECGEEQLIVTITDSGSGPDEFGTNHWFSGEGKCTECDYKGCYSDSSH